MKPRRLALTLLAVAGLATVAALEAHGSASGRFTYRGTVASVVDGDTIGVRLTTGKLERVRLIGIDAPERGACFSATATSVVEALAKGKRVVLKGDPSQDTRDRYRRLLAYVWLPGGKDLGFQVIARGAAKVYVYNRPFQRLTAYRNAEAIAKKLRASVWTCGTSKPPTTTTQKPPPTRRCHPSYVGACLDPNASDYDCAGGEGDGPKYTGPVRVVGPDDFGLDRDGDGYGCEP